MEIFVNGNVLAFSLENETTLGPVYSGLADWAEQGNKRIWSLNIDGTKYDITKPDTFADLNIADITRMDVTIGEISASKEMASRVDSFKADIKVAIGLIDEIVNDFHQGEEGAGREKWQKVIFIINNFHQVLHILSDINISADKETYEKDYIEFKNILMEVQKAQELNDSVAFCDQLLYELQPQFEKWLDFLVSTRSSIKKGK